MMKETTETMEVEPGEIVENSISEQDKDVLSIYVGEDARHAFSDDEHETELPVRSGNQSDLKTATNFDWNHREESRSFSRDIYQNKSHPKNFRSVGQKKFYNRTTRGRRFASNNWFRRPLRTFGFDFRNRKWRRERRKDWSFFRHQPRRLCRPLVFCSTNEGYTLTNGSRWHTSELVSLDTWIDDVFDAIQYLTDNACCQPDDLENSLIVYVPDDLSWRRMNDVISQYKNYWACTISLRKVHVEVEGNTRWIPHHRDMAERMLKELTP